VEIVQVQTAQDVEFANGDVVVWRTLSSRIAQLVDSADLIHPVARQRLGQLFEWSETPTLDELNIWIAPTGWSVTHAQGYVDIREYQTMLSDGIFPVAREIRSIRHLEHSAAPDFLHDAIGHLPMLFDAGYRELLHEWAIQGLKAPPSSLDRAVSAALSDLISAKTDETTSSLTISNLTKKLEVAHIAAAERPSRCFQFENFFTWAIEFGGIGQPQDGSYKTFGAAALSSPGELRNLIEGQVEILDFSLETTVRPVDYTDYQDVMFTVDNFSKYFDILKAI